VAAHIAHIAHIAVMGAFILSEPGFTEFAELAE